MALEPQRAVAMKFRYLKNEHQYRQCWQTYEWAPRGSLTSNIAKPVTPTGEPHDVVGQGGIRY
jgi:hypothetical protein